MKNGLKYVCKLKGSIVFLKIYNASNYTIQLSCNNFEFNKLMFFGKGWQLIGPPKIYLGSTQILELNLNSCLEYNQAVYYMNIVQ